MAIKITINIVLIAALVIVQLAFVGNLPYPASSLKLVLIALLYILVLVSLKSSLWWAIGSGALADIYAMDFFGTSILQLLVIVMIMHLLLVKYFTDRSIYTFIALASIALLTQDAVRGLAGFAGGLIYGSPPDLSFEFFIYEGYALLVNLAVVAILFYFVNYITVRFKPVFLIRKQK